MVRSSVAALAVSGVLFFAQVSSAAFEVVSLAGLSAIDNLGSPNNDVLNIDLGPSSTVTGIGWDLLLFTFGNSWAEDVTIGLGSTSQPNLVTLSAFGGVPEALGGVSRSSPIVVFADIPLADIVLDADGLFRIEIADTFGDFPPGEAEAVFSDGSSLTVQFTPIPEPATLALLGLSGLALLRGRRSRA